MDTHTDTAVAEAPAEAQAELPLATETAVAEAPESALDQLPDAATEQHTSFSDAIDAALSQLESGSDQITPDPEPAKETKEVQPEEAPEPESEPPLADKAEQENTESEDQDLLESLSEDVADWTPKAANRFKQLKGELKNSRSELDQLRQTVEEQKSKLDEMTGLVENRDIDKLQESVADYEYDRAFENLEETQAYQQSVTEPLNKLVDIAHQIGDHYEVDSDTVLDILGMEDQIEQDAAIQQYFGEATDRDRATLYRVLDGIDPILDRRQQLYDNVQDALNEANMLEEQRVNSEKAAAAQHRANVTRNVVTRVNEKLPFLSGVEGLDMGAVESKAAETDPSVVHPVDFAYNAVAAQLLPVIVKEYMTSRKDVDNLMDKLASYEDAEPTMSGTPASDGTIRQPSDVSFADAINRALGE
tara:strand:+ start:2843 stop:4096 length:1254 start_codon:yes stop_codon:yes gene_type:complete